MKTIGTILVVFGLMVLAETVREFVFNNGLVIGALVIGFFWIDSIIVDRKNARAIKERQDEQERNK